MSAAARAGSPDAWAADVAADADVVVVSVNLNQVPVVAALVQAAPVRALSWWTRRTTGLPSATAPSRASRTARSRACGSGGSTDAPVTKAWNSVLSASFAEKGHRTGSTRSHRAPGRRRRPPHRATTMTLVEDTGFDAVDAGDLSASWRQQPGAPAYCTDLTADELPAALDRADASRSPLRRDLVGEVVTERATAGGDITGDYLLALNRAIY